MIYIDDLIGVKFRKNGRSKKEGFDCYGLAIEVSKRYGHNLADLLEEASKNPETELTNDNNIIFSVHDGTKYTKDISSIPVRVVNEPQKEGDLVLFLNSRKIPYHIGVYVGDGRLIHCNKMGVHIERLKNMDYLVGRVYSWLE